MKDKPVVTLKFEFCGLNSSVFTQQKKAGSSLPTAMGELSII
ncbi:hypothetical protein BAOM_1234 [Peribacillus asahii]|uniref:Uncharacterized protein n=1 Tax=Peribacillus asahii TaxID=228899 RepID=A0A3Q9RLA6_9BACI|nr:hypothetical protein BAOM_1234 [Peribacillus asahii]